MTSLFHAHEMTLFDPNQPQGVPKDPLFDRHASGTGGASGENKQEESEAQSGKHDTNISNPAVGHAPSKQNKDKQTPPKDEPPAPEQGELVFPDMIDREKIAAFINDTALITYQIRSIIRMCG